MGCDLTQAVRQLLDAEGIALDGARILVGFSGGADSTALLHVLHANRIPWGIAAVAAAHLHHGLRGKEADEDMDATAAFCRGFGIAWYGERADISAVAKRDGIGIEAAGRQERYAFFRRVSAAQGYTHVATAHTAGDNAETLLLHMTRGCGLSGLCGIAPVRDGVIRPLLRCTRRMVEDYCRWHGLSYTVDASNYDLQYTRNRLRHDVTSVLRDINPRFDEKTEQMTRLLRLDAAYMHDETVKLYDLTVDKDNRLRIPVWESLHAAFRGRVLRMWLEKTTGATTEYQTVEAVQRLALEGGGVSLTGRRRAVRKGDKLVIEKQGGGGRQSSPEAPIVIYPDPACPQTVSFCGVSYKILVEPKKKGEFYEKIHKKFSKYTCDYDKVNLDMRLRGRCPGDRLHPSGRGIGKTVKGLMQELGIGTETRGCLPIVCDRSGIIMIPGVCVDQRAAVDRETRTVLRIIPEGAAADETLPDG